MNYISGLIDYYLGHYCKNIKMNKIKRNECGDIICTLSRLLTEKELDKFYDVYYDYIPAGINVCFEIDVEKSWENCNGYTTYGEWLETK